LVAFKRHWHRFTCYQSKIEFSKFSSCGILASKVFKRFLGNKGGGRNAASSINSKIKAGGWWTFKYDKIEKFQADLWALVLYRFSHRDYDFVIIKPNELLERYKKLGNTSGIIQSHIWVTENGQYWETRGLGKAEQEAIATDVSKTQFEI
jgi:hypothetical protein